MKEFGMDSFSRLLPQVSTQQEEGEPYENRGSRPAEQSNATILASEIAVLTEIVRRTSPCIPDPAGGLRYATKGEFNDIKDAIRQELFSPKPANIVTQEMLLEVVGGLTQQLAEVSARLEEVTAPAAATAKPAKKKASADE